MPHPPRATNGHGAVPLVQQRFAAIAAAAVIGFGLLLEGLNDNFGPGLLCLGFSAILVTLLVLRPPPLVLWRRSLPALGLLALALLWASLVSLPRLNPAAAAPDLLLGGIVKRWGYVAALLVGLIAGYHGMRVGLLNRWLLAIGLVGVAIGLLAASGAFGDVALWGRSPTHRFLGTLANANAAAAAYGALSVLAFAGALSQFDLPKLVPVRLAGYAIAFVLAFGAMLATASRAAAVITVGALLLTALPQLPRRSGMRSALIALLAVFTALLAWTLRSALLAERMSRLGDESALRPYLWHHYLGIAGAAPITGFGVDSFSALAPRYVATVPIAETTWTVNAPHNILLSLLLEGGVVYLALATAAVVLIARPIVARLMARPGADQIAAVSAILVVVGMAMVDIALDVPILVALVLLLAGVLWGRALAVGDIDVRRPRIEPAREESGIAGRTARASE